MQRDLENLEKRWGLALQSASFGVWDLDVPAHLVRYSPQWKQMLGYGSDDAPDPTSTWRSRVYSDDLSPMLQALSQHLRGETPHYEHEFRLRAADGSWRWVLSRGRVVERAPCGEALRAVGTLTDMTDRQQAESLRIERDRAEAGSQAKTEFLSRMSHELRTPLNAVLGFAQLLANPGSRLPPEEQRRYAHHIELAGWQLLRLVDDALDLASLEAGRLNLTLEPLALEAALRSALFEVSTTAALGGVQLRAATVPMAARVRADAMRLQQVLTHLLHNAIRHNHPGGEVSVTVQAQPASALQEGHWTISVRDTGPGMAPEQLAHLFEPFNRHGRSPGAMPDSVGLGLALMRSLLQTMGGSMAVQSSLGQGSCFQVTLPAA